MCLVSDVHPLVGPVRHAAGTGPGGVLVEAEEAELAASTADIDFGTETIIVSAQDADGRSDIETPVAIGFAGEDAEGVGCVEVVARFKEEVFRDLGVPEDIGLLAVDVLVEIREVVQGPDLAG